MTESQARNDRKNQATRKSIHGVSCKARERSEYHVMPGSTRHPTCLSHQKEPDCGSSPQWQSKSSTLGSRFAGWTARRASEANFTSCRARPGIRYDCRATSRECRIAGQARNDRVSQAHSEVDSRDELQGARAQLVSRHAGLDPASDIIAAPTSSECWIASQARNDRVSQAPQWRSKSSTLGSRFTRWAARRAREAGATSCRARPGIRHNCRTHQQRVPDCGSSPQWQKVKPAMTAPGTD